MKNLNKLYQGLTAMSVLAVLAPITGDEKWLTFLCFLAFFGLIKTTYDERMKANIAKANRNGYYTALFCFTGMLLAFNLNFDKELAINMVQVSIVLCTLVTAVSFTYLEKSGK